MHVSMLDCQDVLIDLTSLKVESVLLEDEPVWIGATTVVSAGGSSGYTEAMSAVLRTCLIPCSVVLISEFAISPCTQLCCSNPLGVKARECNGNLQQSTYMAAGPFLGCSFSTELA